MAIVIVKLEATMVSDAKERMVAGAAQLLARHGLQGTSFSEVLELTGAPRGSVYHHFPAGKDQLVDAALTLAGDRALGYLKAWRGATSEEVTDRFLALWREVLTRSQFQSGCAVVAVTVATDSPALLDHAAAIFRSWRGALADLFVADGMPAADAERAAALLVAASEGAVVVARAEQSLEPFELVAAELLAKIIPTKQDPKRIRQAL